MVDDAGMVEMWRRMVRIRRFDLEAKRLLAAGAFPGVLHLTTGQEAAVVGACMALGEEDRVVGTHRSHGYPIARGAALGPLMAEIFGKATGVCKGKGGEVHLIDPSVGAMFGSAILASAVPVAVGMAYTSQVKGTRQVVLAAFGDGASNEGAVHESMNLASIWRLPVVFLCENNGYSITVPASYAISVSDVADRAAGYGMPGHIVDGEDPVAVHQIVRAAAERARAGGGPSLVEVKTYRTVEHAENISGEGDPYRSAEEVARWAERDPVVTFRKRLRQDGQASEATLAGIEANVDGEIAAATAFAQDSPSPALETLWEDMYVDTRLNRPPVHFQ
jgi:TPP-dependent pyruvate/acetoin dehydrogenase alpha subunit